MPNLPELVVVQFSFGNGDLVPLVLQRRLESESKAQARKAASPNGTMILPPTDETAIENLVDDLAGDYTLVSAFYERRQDTRQAKEKKPYYHVVRFTFARKELANVSEDFAKLAPSLSYELFELCRCAFWRARAYLNPRVKDGLIVDGEHILSLNFEARKEVIQSDGQPVTVWLRDSQGRKIGNQPQVLKPKAVLRIVQGHPDLAD